jgi:hypothetical protein
MTDPELRLVLQTALLGEVGRRLRAVCYRNRDEHVAIRFYLDGPIASEDRESAACVVTEVIAALPEHVRISEELIQCDWPARLPPNLPRVYQRRE